MKRLLIAICISFLAGCSSGLVLFPVTDADNFISVPIARIKADGPLAVSVDGQRVAWGDTELNLHDLKGGTHEHLLNFAPDSLCWSPDGMLLAATAHMDGESHLYVFDRSGVRSYEQLLPGRVSRLQWPESGQLTASVLTEKAFSYGTHIKGELFQWDSRWRVVKTALFETTLNPRTAAQLSGRLHKTFDFDLSLFEDELLYTRLYSPPAFSASRHLLLHNLQTGIEKQIAVLPIESGAGRLLADGESALISLGTGQIRLQNLWTGRDVQDWSGDSLNYHAVSGVMQTDDKLFQGQRVLARLPKPVRTQFSATGHFLLVEWNRGLYLLSGYPVEERVKIDAVHIEKLQKIRRLRSCGLISLEEYSLSRERLLQ